MRMNLRNVNMTQKTFRIYSLGNIRGQGLWKTFVQFNIGFYLYNWSQYLYMLLEH